MDDPSRMIRGTNTLFIGTGVGAKLIEYDLDTGDKTDITNVFSDKGKASKTYDLKVVEGHLFVRLNKGGGSIHGGLGKSPIAAEAELFIWDIRQGEKVFQTVPVPGK